MVVSGSLAGWRILMAPSLGTEGQLDLVGRMGDRLRSDLLLAGNPRSGEGLGPELLAAVQPRVVVVAGGPTTLHGKTPPAVRRRLRDLSARVFYTEDLGGLELHFGERLELRSANGDLVGRWSREAVRESRRRDTTALP